MAATAARAATARARAATEADEERSSSGAPATAPRLVGVSTQLLLVSPVRLALGAAALVAARIAGVEPSVALALFGLGTGGLVLAIFTDPRRRLLRPAGEPGPPPPDAVYAAARDALVSALFPSTVTVAVLAAVALAFDARLTAVLGGALAGMGVASLMTAAQMIVHERAAGVRFYADPGGRLYRRSS